MAKYRSYHAGRKPLGILMGLAGLLLLAGVGITVVSVQNQTSTQSSAATRTITTTSLKLYKVKGKCQLTTYAVLKNNSSRKQAVKYRFELIDLNKQAVVDTSSYKTVFIASKKTKAVTHTFTKGVVTGFNYKVRLRVTSPVSYYSQSQNMFQVTGGCNPSY